MPIHTEGEEYQLPTGPSRHAQTQYSREGHQHIQGSLHCRNLRDGPILTDTKLVPNTQESGDHTKLTMPLKAESKTFDLRAAER